MITVCPTCEPYDHGGQDVRWRVCPRHERILKERPPLWSGCPFCNMPRDKPHKSDCRYPESP